MGRTPDADLHTIMGAPQPGAETLYDQLCTAYRAECRANEAALVESYAASGLLEEILRPLPLHQALVSA